MMGSVRLESSPALRVHVGIVVGSGSDEQVIRSPTGWVVAGVADKQAVRNRAIDRFVRKPMDQRAAETAVTVLVDSASPFPAPPPGPSELMSGLRQLLDGHRVALRPPALVVQGTPPPLDAGLLAAINRARWLWYAPRRPRRGPLARPSGVMHDAQSPRCDPLVAAFDGTGATPTGTLRHLGPPTRFGQGPGSYNCAGPTHYRASV